MGVGVGNPVYRYIHRRHYLGGNMRKCPICASAHDNVDGVIMHLRNKEGGGHDQITNQYEAVQVIQDSDDAVPEVSRESMEAEESDDDQLEEDSTPVESDTDPSSYFDEPDGRPIANDDIPLPCEHEYINPEDLPDREILVTCSVCGDQWAFSK